MADRKLTLQLEVAPPEPGHGFDRMAKEAADSVKKIQEDLRRATGPVPGQQSAVASLFGGITDPKSLMGLDAANKGVKSLSDGLNATVAGIGRLTGGLASLGLYASALDPILGRFYQLTQLMSLASGSLGTIQGVVGAGGGASGASGAAAGGAAGAAGGGIMARLMGFGRGALSLGGTALRTAGGAIGSTAGALGTAAVAAGGLAYVNASSGAQNWLASNLGDDVLNLLAPGGYRIDRRSGEERLARMMEHASAMNAYRSRIDRMTPGAEYLAGLPSARRMGITAEMMMPTAPRRPTAPPTEGFVRASARRSLRAFRPFGSDEEEAAPIATGTFSDLAASSMGAGMPTARMAAILRVEEEARDRIALEAPFRARLSALGDMRESTRISTHIADSMAGGLLAERAFGRSAGETQRLMGRGLAAHADPSDIVAFRTAFAETERQFRGAEPGNAAARGAVREAQTRVMLATESRDRAAEGVRTAPTGEHRRHQMDLLVQANERLLAAQQQQVQANRQLRETEIGRLENYRAMLQQAHALARVGADSYRRQTRQQSIGLALAGPEQQQQALHVSGRLRAIVDSGRGELNEDELAFAQGNEMFRPLLERYGERLAGGNATIAQIQQNLGRPEEQRRLDGETERLAVRERELNSRVGVAIQGNAREFSREVDDLIRPEFERMARDLGLSLSRAIDDHVRRITLPELDRGLRALAGGFVAAGGR